MRYIHDCENCVFLTEKGIYDIYLCPTPERVSLIARYGNRPDKYASIPLWHKKQLVNFLTCLEQNEKRRK